MTSRINRHHAEKFKFKVCAEIRSGSIGRREAQRVYKLSDNLIHAWLVRYDCGNLHADGVQYSDEQLRLLKRKIDELLNAVKALDKRAVK